MDCKQQELVFQKFFKKKYQFNNIIFNRLLKKNCCAIDTIKFNERDLKNILNQWSLNLSKKLNSQKTFLNNLYKEEKENIASSASKLIKLFI